MSHAKYSHVPTSRRLMPGSSDQRSAELPASRRPRSVVVFRFAARLCLAVACGLVAGDVSAAVYSGPTQSDHPIDPAIAASDTRFVEWADRIDPARTRFAPRGSTQIDQTGGFNSLGDLTSDEIAAGEQPGFLTVTNRSGVRNGSGADFAVFENGFVFPSDPYLFMELAYVEVSSNGQDFARFPSISLNETFEGGFGQSFAGFDSRNVHNLAGKHAAGYGTPFDLDTLTGDPLVVTGAVDLDDIRYVKLVDIPGDGSFLDSEGNGILDTWPTGGGTGGFDFRLGEGLGVGVIHTATAVPEPAGWAMIAALVSFVAVRSRRRAVRTSRVSNVGGATS